MLDRRIVRLARRLIPAFLQHQINPFDRLMLRTMERFCAILPANARVLDAGAGEAQYRPVFERAGRRYFAIDLGVGEPDWKYEGIDALANTEDLPFPAATFDGVVSLAVLEHSPRPRKVIHELSAVLRPGGRLLIVVPTMWEEHQMPNDFYRFTRHGIARLLEEAGFEIAEQRAIGGYFWFMGRKSIDVLEFFQRPALWIFWALLVIPFGIVIPILCRHLDWLDKDKYYTIGQICVARKVRDATLPAGAPVLP